MAQTRMPVRPVSIYVEILIHAPLDVLWRNTQDPARHTCWDLRFSRIEYLPRASEDEPQRFLYATRIGFGLAIVGEGESVGQRDLPGGERVSSLKFGSADWRSLIREGSGFWKYVPTPEGVRFLTRYDYRTRFGAMGACFDRLVFRPLMGWATAWSFDRLRLWLETGTSPDVAFRQFLTRVCARGSLAAVFLYHGLIPKLLRHDADELAMLRDSHVPPEFIPLAVSGFGWLEIGFAFLLLTCWQRRWPSVLCLPLMLAATLGVVWFSPRYLGAAFNPVSLNGCVVALTLIDLLHQDAPSAARCRREPPHDSDPA